MKKNIRRRVVWAGFTVLMTFFLLFSGCAMFKGKKSGSSAASTSTRSKNEKAPHYQDFSDILIPGEMKMDKKNSFVYKTPGFTSGVLSAKGRVDANSLIRFFENNMEKDNWSLVSAFVSPRTIMLYQKENRWCVINISDKDFNTYAEIWVAPTAEGASNGLLK